MEQHWGYAEKARAVEQVDQRMEAARLESLEEAEVRRQRLEVQNGRERILLESVQAVEELGLVAEEEALPMTSFHLRKEEVRQTLASQSLHPLESWGVGEEVVALGLQRLRSPVDVWEG